MTSRIFSVLQAIFTIAFLLVIAGCEEPTPKAEQGAPPIVNEERETVTADAVEKEAAEPNKPGYPYFHISRDGETLVVDGALKSGGQVKQIERELKEYFSKLTIKSGLRKDPLRHAVGWGNRVSDAVLFDYFTLVSDPEIEYKEGVITLKGSVKGGKEHRLISEMVIAGFSDIWTHDMVNEIKVGN